MGISVETEIVTRCFKEVRFSKNRHLGNYSTGPGLGKGWRKLGDEFLEFQLRGATRENLPNM